MHALQCSINVTFIATREPKIHLTHFIVIFALLRRSGTNLQYLWGTPIILPSKLQVPRLYKLLSTLHFQWSFPAAGISWMSNGARYCSKHVCNPCIHHGRWVLVYRFSSQGVGLGRLNALSQGRGHCSQGSCVDASFPPPVCPAFYQVLETPREAHSCGLCPSRSLASSEKRQGFLMFRTGGQIDTVFCWLNWLRFKWQSLVAGHRECLLARDIQTAQHLGSWYPGPFKCLNPLTQ